MTNQKSKPDRALLVLGVVITFPMILASGPIVGYVIGQYILVNYFGLMPAAVPILAGLGFAASAMQCYRLLKKINEIDTNQKKGSHS